MARAGRALNSSLNPDDLCSMDRKLLPKIISGIGMPKSADALSHMEQKGYSSRQVL
jgi:hypothetical protein